MTSSMRRTEGQIMGLKNPEEVWDSQFKNLFEKKEPTETEQILNVVSLIVHSDKNDDMGRLYSRVGLKTFSEVLDVFGGRYVKFMTKEEFKDSLMLALCYYYRETRGFSWEKIKAILPFQINTVSMGIRISNMNSRIKKEIDRIFSEIANKDLVVDDEG